MKLSVLTLALSAFGASAQDGLPDPFVEQCCGGSLPGAIGPIPAIGIRFHIAGHDNEECQTLGPGCVTMEELCRDYSYVGVQGELDSSGLLCIDPTAPATSVPLDNVWTCSSNIGWAGLPTDPGPTSTDTGYHCGRVQLCKNFGITCGDPHFQTWAGEWYDFHGECDLKFLEVPEFGNGLGLSIDIRTKARYEYSYIEAAAVKIGDDVLEVSSYGAYILNGVEGADVDGAKLADLYRVEHEIKDAEHHVFKIYTGMEHDGKVEAIVIKTFKDLVAVKTENAFLSTFGNAVGMLGDYDEGKLFARDGKTIIEDITEFGMEWQVRSNEPNLFQTASPVIGKCVMPSEKAAEKRRRLGEQVPLEAAVAACEAVDHIHLDNCVYDVMATGDLDIVFAGVF